jgi:hypothetical protein
METEISYSLHITADEKPTTLEGKGELEEVTRLDIPL